MAEALARLEDSETWFGLGHAAASAAAVEFYLGGAVEEEEEEGKEVDSTD